LNALRRVAMIESVGSSTTTVWVVGRRRLMWRPVVGGAQGQRYREVELPQLRKPGDLVLTAWDILKRGGAIAGAGRQAPIARRPDIVNRLATSYN
jgi:hypothetical protein